MPKSSYKLGVTSIKATSSHRQETKEESKLDEEDLESDETSGTGSSAPGDTKQLCRRGRRKRKRGVEPDPPWKFSWEKSAEELEVRDDAQLLDLKSNTESAKKLKKFQTFGQLQVVIGILFILMVFLCGTSVSSQEYFNLLLQNHYDVMWLFMLSTLVSFYSGFYAIYASHDYLSLRSYYLRLAFLLCLPAVFIVRSLMGLENIVSNLKTLMIQMQQRFSRIVIARSFWNHLQQGAECCGIDSPGDWKQHLSLIERNLDKFPQSCCKDYEQCSLRNSSDSWPTGCYNPVLHGSLWTGLCLLGICVAQISFQVATVVLAIQLYQKHSLMLHDGRTVSKIFLGPFASLCWSADSPLRKAKSDDIERYSGSWNKERFKQNRVGPYPHVI